MGLRWAGAGSDTGIRRTIDATDLYAHLYLSMRCTDFPKPRTLNGVEQQQNISDFEIRDKDLTLFDFPLLQQ